MTEVATETKDEVKVAQDTPSEDTRSALQATARKHGITLPETEDDRVVEAAPSSEEVAAKDKEAKATPKSDEEPTLTLTAKQQTTAKYMKLDAESLAAMGEEKALALLDRLTKVREDTAKAMAGKNKRPDPEPDPVDSDDEPATRVEADDPAEVLKAEFSEELWGDAAGPMNAMRTMILGLQDKVSSREASEQDLATEQAKMTVDRFVQELPESIRKTYDDQDRLDTLVEKAADLRQASMSRGIAMTEEQALEEANAIVARQVLDKASETRGVRKARHESRIPRPNNDGKTPLGPANDTLSALQDVAAKHGIRLAHNEVM